MISLPAALDARMQRESQLTFFEYMVLSVLSEQPARIMQMSALAARTAASLSRLSHVVGRLEKRALLARNRIPGSGRRTDATLTEAGYEVVVAAAPGHVAAVREYLIDDLGPVFPGKTYLDWKLDDPAGRGIDVIRPIRDEIEQRIRGLLTALHPH
ncbi:MarR family transcriptional regulator [Streptomyces carpaticus]|uniref:MarR family transcriptional regulator n=1 Tax=Streptomyces carpaticus TaxID=285558 RepID=UPI0031F93A9F